MVKTTIIIATYPEDPNKDFAYSKLLELGYTNVKRVNLNIKQTFAQNNNQGAREADTDYLLFLNSDTSPEPGFLEQMEKILDSNSSFGVVGAKIYYLNDVDKTIKFKGKDFKLEGKMGEIQSAGIGFTKRLMPEEMGRGKSITDPEMSIPRLVGAVTGACMLVRRKEFLDLGGFDEDFKNGWEDTDFCLRMLKEKKLLSYYQPGAQVGHKYAGSSEHGRFDHEDDNYNLFYKKWHTSGLIYELFKNHQGLKLDVGCGGKKKEGYHGVDKYPGNTTDTIFDLETLSQRSSIFPFADDSVEEIYTSHTLEHISCVVDVMNEFHRVLRPMGLLHVVVPHAFSWGAFASPFHKSFFTPETFTQYFASDNKENLEKDDNEIQWIKPWTIDKLEFTPVPKGIDPLSIQREIVVYMRPLK